MLLHVPVCFKHKRDGTVNGFLLSEVQERQMFQLDGYSHFIKRLSDFRKVNPRGEVPGIIVGNERASARKL